MKSDKDRLYTLELKNIQDCATMVAIQKSIEENQLENKKQQEEIKKGIEDLKIKLDKKYAGKWVEIVAIMMLTAILGILTKLLFFT